uniref:Uncharacterized protein n=1 Tax=Romanomermis culicivorax TaxID=13658 RepID=A0A915JZ65_ROMCU
MEVEEKEVEGGRVYLRAPPLTPATPLGPQCELLLDFEKLFMMMMGKCSIIVSSIEIDEDISSEETTH